MLKLLMLKYLRKKFRKLKIKMVRQRNFEAATIFRDKEKQKIEQISALQDCWQRRFNKLSDAFMPVIFKFEPTDLNGFVVLRKPDNIPVRIDGYMFAVWMNIYIEAALAESEKFRKAWKAAEDKAEYRNTIFEWAAEYFFIDTFASQLSSHNGTFEMNRSHIADLLQTNPILNLFSGEIKHRKAFSDSSYIHNTRSHHALDPDGNIMGYFNTFSYKFPFKCKIERSNRAIKLTTPYYSIRFKISCTGNAQSLPQDYSLFYLGFKRNSGRRIDAHIVATKRFGGLLPWNRKHIKQVHGLKETLIEYFSAKHYFDKLDWENKRVMAVVMRNITSMKVSL